MCVYIYYSSVLLITVSLEEHEARPQWSILIWFVRVESKWKAIHRQTLSGKIESDMNPALHHLANIDKTMAPHLCVTGILLLILMFIIKER